MDKKFWSWKNSVESNGNELVIEGDISSQESWWGDSATPEMLRDELKEHTGDLTVSLNSGGGDVFAGVAMYNALRKHDGNVTVRVDGLAASIASVIAMAGDKIVMSPGAMMMIHKPWTLAIGDANEMDKVKEVLNSIEKSMLPIYTARTGKSEAEIQDMLNAETWMTAQEAVDLGFADEAIDAKEGVSISDAVKNLMSGKFALNMSATKDSMSGLLEKVKAQEAEKEKEISNDATNPTPSAKKTDEPEAKADDEAQAKDKEKVAEPAEPVAKIKAKKETTDMDPKDKVTDADAAAMALEPKNQANPDATPKVSLKAYLKTKESMEAFARILEENAVSGAAKDVAGNDASQAVRAAWKDHLEVKLGVTNPEIFLPTPLIQEIEDAFNNGGEIWRLVSKTGMDSFNAAWDLNDDPDAESGRASGYNREEEEEKREQQLEFDNRILRPQFVYKYITLNKEDVKEQRSTGALVRFVLSELPRRIIREIERAIVIGDGRAPGSDYKIQEGNPRGFYPVRVDAEANGVFGSVFTPVIGQTVYETLRRARALVKAEGRVILVAKEGLLLDMEFEQNVNGGFLFAPGSDLSRYIKVDAVVEPDWMDNDDNDAYIFVYDKYRVVGDQSIEAFQNFILKTNKNEYLQEIWAGGGLTARKSCVAVAPIGS